MDRTKLIAVEAPEKYLSITWQVNNFCNYSCSYCNPGNWLGDFRNEGELQIYLDNLDTIIDNYFEIDEPTSLIQRFVQPDEVARMIVTISASTASNGAAHRIEGGIVRNIL